MSRISGFLTIIAVVALVLVYAGFEIYKRGYSAAEAVYQQKAATATVQKVENTEKLEAEKEKLKDREKNLNADCKAIYNIDLSTCRLQLRGKN